MGRGPAIVTHYNPSVFSWLKILWIQNDFLSHSPKKCAWTRKDLPLILCPCIRGQNPPQSVHTPYCILSSYFLILPYVTFEASCFLLAKGQACGSRQSCWRKWKRLLASLFWESLKIKASARHDNKSNVLERHCECLDLPSTQLSKSLLRRNIVVVP